MKQKNMKSEESFYLQALNFYGQRTWHFLEEYLPNKFDGASSCWFRYEF